MCDEQWKTIPEDPRYAISNQGRVKFKPSGKIRGTYTKNGGYVCIRIPGVETYIHRLVAKLFLPNPDNLSTVDHIDEDKSNNFVTNLQWMSGRENWIKSNQVGGELYHPNLGFVKFENSAEFSRKYGVPKISVCQLLSGERKTALGWQNSRRDSKGEITRFCPEKDLSKEFHLFHEIYGWASFDDVNDFARKYHIGPSKVLRVLRREIPSIGGWRENGDPMEKRSYRLYHDDHGYVDFDNITQFTKKYDVPKSIRRVIWGQWKAFQGWRLDEVKPMGKFDREFQVWHPDHGLATVTNSAKFGRDHGVLGKSIRNMIVGRNKSAGGWVLLENSPNDVRNALKNNVGNL